MDFLKKKMKELLDDDDKDKKPEKKADGKHHPTTKCSTSTDICQLQNTRTRVHQAVPRTVIVELRTHSTTKAPLQAVHLHSNMAALRRDNTNILLNKDTANNTLLSKVVTRPSKAAIPHSKADIPHNSKVTVEARPLDLLRLCKCSRLKSLVFTSKPDLTFYQGRSSANATWLDSAMGPEQPALVLRRASHWPHPMGSSPEPSPGSLCASTIW